MVAASVHVNAEVDDLFLNYFKYAAASVELLLFEVLIRDERIYKK